MTKLYHTLSGLPRWSLTLLCLALILVVGVIDLWTGVELSLSILYLAPVSLIAWLAGGRHGVVLSLAGAATWFAADRLAGSVYSHAAIPFWNAAVRLGFFLVVTAALSTLRALQDRHEELSQFVVHDLRSPVANVLTGLYILRDLEGDSLNSTQMDIVESCIVSCNRMSTLINSLLDLAQLEANRMPLKLEEVDAKELVDSALEQVSVWASRHQVSLTSRLEPGAKRVWADSELVVRVLVNLLSNAIKFSRPDSVVSVRVAPHNADEIALSVTDQGMGIPREWARKVFDKYVQVESRRAGETVGSGLGLRFCYLAVQAHGGRIWLESELGQGTTVTCSFPGRCR